MPGKVYNLLQRTPIWQVLVVCVIAAELLTFFISLGVSHLLWGALPTEVMIIGIIDSLIVSFIVVSVLLFSLRTIRGLYVELEKQNHELSSAISEIKTLRGILPICSYCKQVRNDKGYYEQIESYVHKHSGVDFSHTICPDCMKKHHSDLDENDLEVEQVPQSGI